MLTFDKSFCAFNRTKQPFAFVRVNGMLDVLLVRKQFQIVNAIIGSVKVFMVDFQSTFNRPNKSLPQSPVNSNFSVFSIFTRRRFRHFWIF